MCVLVWRVIMVINSTGAVNAGAQQNGKAVKQITVAKGDTVTKLAAKFGMDVKTFMKLTGLKDININIGQKINHPMDSVPKSSGIYFLINKYNMTEEEFGKLNNLPKPYKQYSARVGEKFYVVMHKKEDKPKAVENNTTDTKISSAKSGTASAETEEKQKVSKIETAASSDVSSPEPAVEETAVKNAAADNEKKWGSPFTPQEIASTLEKEAKNRFGAVGKKSFNDMLDQINPKNASAVIKAYDESDYGQSLINRITHEVVSTETSRKKAVMQVYDALAAEKKIPHSLRAEFEKELNDRFDDWGMVDTKKLDEIINNIISGEIKGLASASRSRNNKRINLANNEGDFTVSSLQRGAVHSAKKEAEKRFETYCIENGIKYSKDKLDLSPLERIPEPTVESTSIVAKETELLSPTTTPNGKVVIINPGHGGYSSRSGYFDPGSYSFIKKGNGKYAPLLEYDKMQIYAESTADKLRARGYAVVITNAHVETITDRNSISDLVENLNNGTKGDKKYDKENIMFISLHADSEPGKSGSGVCYDSRFSNDSKLAEDIKNELNTDDWISASVSERNWDVPKHGLQVLHQTEDIPSVLIEVEYVNGAKSKNLDSSAYQTRFENKLIDGIDKYFNE